MIAASARILRVIVVRECGLRLRQQPTRPSGDRPDGHAPSQRSPALVWPLGPDVTDARAPAASMGTLIDGPRTSAGSVTARGTSWRRAFRCEPQRTRLRSPGPARGRSSTAAATSDRLTHRGDSPPDRRSISAFHSARTVSYVACCALVITSPSKASRKDSRGSVSMRVMRGSSHEVTGPDPVPRALQCGSHRARHGSRPPWPRCPWWGAGFLGSGARVRRGRSRPVSVAVPTRCPPLRNHLPHAPIVR